MVRLHNLSKHKSIDNSWDTVFECVCAFSEQLYIIITTNKIANRTIKATSSMNKIAVNINKITNRNKACQIWIWTCQVKLDSSRNSYPVRIHWRPKWVIPCSCLSRKIRWVLVGTCKNSIDKSIRQPKWVVPCNAFPIG